MSNNKQIREEMIKKYGNECMMESADIRYIPNVLDENRQGRNEEDNRLTYHHIKPKAQGGEATEENGAVIRWNNHKWLESQSKEVRDKINKELQEFKAFIKLKKAKEEAKKCEIAFAHIRNGKVDGEKAEFDMSDTLDIPLISNEEKELER